MIDLAGYGKVAIVTGCSSGIGLATTLLFLKHQYQVFGVDITAFDYKVLDRLNGGQFQGKFHFHLGDLTEPGECEAGVRICIAQFGERVDVLANVAGVMDGFSSADTITDAEWSRVIDVNLTAPIKMMREVLPFMKAKKQGCIINVSSKAGMSGAAAGIAYTASKHGLIGATKNVAWRFHSDGIRCNTVLPGSVATNLHNSISQETFDAAAFETLKPIHALSTPLDAVPDISAADIANAILFLASDEAKMINGVCLPVDHAWGVI